MDGYNKTVLEHNILAVWQAFMKDRIHAFLIHFGISIFIAVVSVIFVFYIWYPEPLHEAVGVTDIFLIVLAVDVTIGPVLTFVVFKRNKPSLPFDLSVIAVLQLVALVYGMLTVFEGRPAFVVYNNDRFDVSRANDIDPASSQKAKQDGNEYGKVGWFSPLWVGAVKSDDPERRAEIMFSSVKGGPDWPQLPELFVSLSKVKQSVIGHARPLQALYDLYQGKDEKLKVLADWKDNQDIKWLPLRGPVKDMVVLVNASSGGVIRVVDVSPWP